MNIEKLRFFAKNYPAVPVTIDFELPDFDPIDLTHNLNQDEGPCFLFTGQPKPDEDGYSFIGLDPELAVTFKDGILTVEDSTGVHTRETLLNPFFESLLKKYQTPKIPSLPPFLGGFAGYLSYDYARFANPTLPQKLADPYNLNDADFLLIKKVIAYNHKTHRVTLSKIIPSTQLDTLFEETIAELHELKRVVIDNNHVAALPKFQMNSAFKLHFDQAEFAEKVVETKQHIVDGDIFQLILSNPQHATMSGSLYPVTKNLFHDSPAPYQFFYKHHNFETVGSSP